MHIILPLLVMYDHVILQMELQQSGSLLGYRAMWQRLRKKYKISIPRYYLTMIPFNNVSANYYLIMSIPN